MVCASLVLSFGQLQLPVCEPTRLFFALTVRTSPPWAGYAGELGRFFGLGIPSVSASTLATCLVGSELWAILAPCL